MPTTLFHSRTVIHILRAFSLPFVSGIMFNGAIDPSGKPTVEVQIAQRSMEMTVTIRKEANSDLVLKRANVPWLFRKSVELVVMETNSTTRRVTRIQMVRSLIDPPLGDIEIRSGAEASGSINLAYLFPSLSSVLKSNDVLVCWAYTMRGRNLTNRFTGSVLLAARP